jgi:hypothetical protein
MQKRADTMSGIHRKDVRFKKAFKQDLSWLRGKIFLKTFLLAYINCMGVSL